MNISEQYSVPPVWRWYVAYCVAMALIYLLVAVAGVFGLSVRPSSSGPEEQLALQAGLMIVLGILFLLPYLAAPFLPKRRWAWIYGLVMIAIGMTSICCLPATIPLLIFWIKPETKGFFGYDKSPSAGWAKGNAQRVEPPHL